MAEKHWAVAWAERVFTNVRQPMPLPKKIRLLTRNTLIRAMKRQTCCGHDGEPGC